MSGGAKRSRWRRDKERARTLAIARSRQDLGGGAMHRVLSLVLFVCLAGCGVATSIIKSDALSFNDVIEDTTNKLLVLNVLRARDKAPLHFADIPVIRESMQQNASLSYVDLIGGILGTTTRNTRAATLG